MSPWSADRMIAVSSYRPSSFRVLTTSPTCASTSSRYEKQADSRSFSVSSLPCSCRRSSLIRSFFWLMGLPSKSSYLLGQSGISFGSYRMPHSSGTIHGE